MQALGFALSRSHARRIKSANFPGSAASRQRNIAITVAASILCAALVGCCQPNDPSCRNVRIGPSGAEVAGIAVGVGAVIATAIAVEVHHSHHTLNGCVSNAPGGLQIQSQGGTNVYTLSGDTARLTAGQKVRLHGTRVKQSKHSTSQSTFVVESTSKVYGDCKLTPGSTTSAP